MKQIIINNISTNYYITKNGKCFNNKTGEYLKGQINSKTGYRTFNLSLPNKQQKRIAAHRLVASAFIPNDDKSKTQINHKDGNKLNNCVDNLEWCTSSENQIHATRTYNHVFCFNKNKELVAEYKNIPEACAAVGLSYSMIHQELHKEIKTLTGNFYWSCNKTIDKVKDYTNKGKAKTVYQYDLKGKFINSYSSTGEAARSLGIKNSSHIGECCRGKIKKYKGFIWRYADDIVLT